MPRLANIKPKEAIKVFEQAGFIIRKQTGSHLILKHYQKNKIISAPIHPRDIKVGLLRGLIAQSGLTLNEFLELL